MTVKEAPARRGLRSVFAGLLRRGKSAPTAAASKAADDQAGHVKVLAPEAASPAEPETVVAETATPETVVAETAAPETVVAETEKAEPETVVAETAAPETVVAETDGADAALPVANYD